jgi:hypothetical protein
MRIYSTIGCILGWLALLAQFYLIILNRTTSVTEAVIRFFTFFTILSNILVALSFTYSLSNSQSSLKKFFSSQSMLAAICVYIVVVGITYNLILRFLWQPTGMQRIVDELLHVIMPMLYLLFWIFFVPKKQLQWTTIFPWLLFPLCYAILVAVRGAFTGYYPYPFIDVTKIGYPKFFLNCLLVTILFFFLSILLVGICKAVGKRAAK